MGLSLMRRCRSVSTSTASTQTTSTEIVAVSIFAVSMFAVVFMGAGAAVGASPSSDDVQDPLDRHLDHLEQALDQRVAAAVAGSYEPQSWLELRRHYLRLSADLEAGELHSLRVRRGLRELVELEALAEDPPALKAHAQRLKSQATDDLEPVEKLSYGWVSGRVIRAADGSPVVSAEVSISSSDLFELAYTDEQGGYLISLPAGSYSVSASKFRLQTELYDNIPCADNCYFPSGDPVVVEGGQTAANINFSLETLGSVSGRVVDEASGLPIGGMFLDAWPVDGFSSVSLDITEADGTFEIEGLPTGDYWIIASGQSYQTEGFDGITCNYGPHNLVCPGGPLQAVSVELGQTTTGVDFTMESRGSISGRVTDAATGEGIPLVWVSFESTGETLGGGVFTDAEGWYQSPGLDTGEYWVSTQNFDGYVEEIHDNVPCPFLQFGAACDTSLGTPVHVAIDTETPNIHFSLDLGGSLSGSVTRALDGLPIEGADIRVFDSNNLDIATVFTEPDGTYTLNGLNPDQYALRAFASGYLVVLYDDIACPYSLCPLPDADRIDVQLGSTTSGLDFELDQLGSIEGRVVSLGDGEPIEGASVQVYEAETDILWNVVTTDAQGVFRVKYLRTGSYRLLAEDSRGLHISVLYPDIPCGQGLCDRSRGGTVDVELNATTTDVEIGLGPGSLIQADIRDRVTGLPTIRGDLTAYDASGNLAGFGFASQEGGYSVPGLPSGQYYVKASGFSFGQQVYGGDSCTIAEVCDPLSGTLVSVVEGGEIPRILFEVDFNDCQFLESELCLRNDRFQAVVKWRNSAGEEGYGNFAPLSNDSGYFWFFDRDNIEGVVKVLNACSPPFERFWVFAAGLTDLDVTLWITDFAAQDTRTYTNAGGQAFQPIQDTDAFDTCPEVFAGGSAVDSPVASSERKIQKPVSAVAKSCNFASGRLCLNNGRFAVEAFYQIPGQPEQLAGANTLTGDSGTFYFFNPDNVEVLVKVLDACSLFDRFWVFGAGLTNVRVRLVVTDTETGEVVEYVNNQGNAFRPIQDTQAFSTCF